MINAQFDLQNIINEMKTVDRASNSSSNSDKEQFSETLDRISRSESLKRSSKSTHQPSEKAAQKSAEKPSSDSRDNADSRELQEGSETNTTQSEALQSSGKTSGNILPLLPPEQPLMNQVMLESKRPILVGDLKAADTFNDQIHEFAASDGLVQETEIGSKNGSDMEGANIKLQSHQNKESAVLRGLPPKPSKLINTEKPDVEIKDNSALNSIHRSIEPRNADLAPGSKSSMPTSPHALDTEAFKEGLSKIIKNQIIDVFNEIIKRTTRCKTDKRFFTAKPSDSARMEDQLKNDTSDPLYGNFRITKKEKETNDMNVTSEEKMQSDVNKNTTKNKNEWQLFFIIEFIFENIIQQVLNISTHPIKTLQSLFDFGSDGLSFITSQNIVGKILYEIGLRLIVNPIFLDDNLKTRLRDVLENKISNNSKLTKNNYTRELFADKTEKCKLLKCSGKFMLEKY